MSCTLSNFVIFAAGLAIGSVATWKFLDAKYKKLAEDEIKEMKEYYLSKTAADENDIQNYESVITDNGYMKYSDIANTPVTKEDENVSKPYVITPDEFGEIDSYDKVSLRYYSDGCLMDEQDEIIENVDEVIGYESLNHFGEFEEDSVFVRNDSLKTDYEILLDPRDYYDIVNEGPRIVERK